MSVAQILRDTPKTLFSFELLPPLKGRSIEDIYRAIDPLIEFNPLNINITYHCPETVYEALPDGSFSKRIVRKRPGSVALAAAIKFKYKVNVIPHVLCAGFTKDQIEDMLIDLNFLEMNDILLLRGDAPKGQRYFIPEPGGHAHTVDLVKQVMAMNQGVYFGKATTSVQTHFSAGVAGYPEKHAEAPNMTADLEHLKEKVDAGAEYIITQLFFDNSKYFSFVEQCRAIGITVPIVAGLKPLTLLTDYLQLPQVFHIDMPQDLISALKSCKTNADVKQVGIEWSVEQSKELIKSGVPALHYYTLGVSDNVKKILETVF
ncbi:MAG: methylenetetrahydrofolate reductase [Bacteroidales bacterium]|nr:methylenetetrahydrofolate reductase [Bacteroidales bacterium]